MRSPKSSNHQEPYIRTRESPYFNGLVSGNAPLMDRTTFDFRGSAGSRNIARSASDIGNMRRGKIFLDASEKVTETPLEDSISDIILEPYGRSSSGRWSKIPKENSFASLSIPSDSSFDLDDASDSTTKESYPRVYEANEGSHILPGLAKPTVERSYMVNKRKQSLSKIPLRQAAASFYNGYSPPIEIVESCESINRLNLYLKARRDDVNAGVPGRFLHAVMGQDVCDVGSIASTIMYAFYLNETLNSNQFCTVPVINLKRADLISHPEVKWLLDSCQLDQSSLIFVDEVDLSYYDLFGSLKLVLLNGGKLPTKQEALKEAVVEIFNCRKGDSVYTWVDSVTVEQDCSCCTVVAEKFALTSPEILSGQGFSRLLLAGILLDTANLTSPHSTSKDKYMATLLINGAGHFGCNGLYQILRFKMYDVSNLKVVDILRKDFRKWPRLGKSDSAGSRSMLSQIGMSSIGLSVGQLLAHEDTATQDIKYFQELEKLRLLMIVSGYYDIQKNFKREILVSAESVELMKNLLSFFNSNASQLPLKVLHQPVVRDDMRAFEIDKTISRKTIEQLLEDFGGTPKGWHI
ncbi:hypothetical protein L1049_009884 [Liquidambar formosana]|uniref:DHHA2 domain-containing protein n=1 Tax=Liquidambar formosana TaxID=63359 RepID=A0AAP0N7G4_LIQFO